jgi:hypothetical protein
MKDIEPDMSTRNLVENAIATSKNDKNITWESYGRKSASAIPDSKVRPTTHTRSVSATASQNCVPCAGRR